MGCTLNELPSRTDGWVALGDHKLDMFAKLDPLPDAHVLVQGVVEAAEAYGYQVGVLTALPKLGRVPNAEQHKREWVEKHFPELLENFRIGPYAEDKQHHYQEGDILIDDSTMNIPQWLAKGGCGILHTSAEKSLAELRAYLEAKHS